MKLVLYSGGQEPSNQHLHRALATLVGKRGPKSLTYIPFCHDGSKPFFNRIKRRYKRFGFSKFYCLPADIKVPKKGIKEALSADAIYLAGGNTFYFLHHLRKSGILPLLKRYAKNGGVLGGLSAGAILMTPHIGLAGYPKFDADENDVKLKNRSALSLVKFEFFPHFENTKRLSLALGSYSRRTRHPLFASEDGAGIVVAGKTMQFLGRCYMFSQGKKIIFENLSVREI